MVDTLHVPGNGPDHAFDVPSGPVPLDYPVARRVVAPAPDVLDGGRDGCRRSFLRRFERAASNARWMGRTITAASLLAPVTVNDELCATGAVDLGDRFTLS